MGRQSFNQAPTVLTLQQLIAPALLIDDLDLVRKAVRLWVILQSLYAPEPAFAHWAFRYRDWRDFFFEHATQSHGDRDRYPYHSQDCGCPCQKTIKQLLFPVDTEEKWEKWQQAFIAAYQDIALLKQMDLEAYVQQLDSVYPFWLTGKAMQTTFQKDLTAKGWLFYEGQQTYRKVEQLPSLQSLPQLNVNCRSVLRNEDELRLNFLLDDLLLVAETLEKPINGIQRLFFYTDYQIPAGEIATKVYSYIKQFKSIWQRRPVPIIQLRYQSFYLNGKIASYTVYPVCFYYYQRSFYLSAFGQTPRQPKGSDWYNFRLDRLISLQVLDSQTIEIPEAIKNKALEEQSEEEQQFIQEDNTYNGPLIEEVQENLEQAYGFDFYLESATMILRFPYEYDRSYIRNTIRHQTFRSLSWQAVIEQINQAHLSQKQKAYLKNKVANSYQDGFYRLNYRKTEYNVVMRLRAWCPNVEVILPWELRQKMKHDIQKTLNLYQNDPN